MQDKLDKRMNNPIISSPYLNFDPSILNPVINLRSYLLINEFLLKTKQ